MKEGEMGLNVDTAFKWAVAQVDGMQPQTGAQRALHVRLWKFYFTSSLR